MLCPRIVGGTAPVARLGAAPVAFGLRHRRFDTYLPARRYLATHEHEGTKVRRPASRGRGPCWQMSA